MTVGVIHYGNCRLRVIRIDLELVFVAQLVARVEGLRDTLRVIIDMKLQGTVVGTIRPAQALPGFLGASKREGS
jgi:hypothetical protein